MISVSSNSRFKSAKVGNSSLVRRADLYAVFDQLWFAGHLHWKLLKHQRPLYELFHLTKHRKIVWHCSRRFGKSSVLLIICNELAIRKKGALIRYGASTQKDVREMILPLQQILLEDCPISMRPHWYASENKYKFPNGSQLVISGCDEGRADNLRGTSCDLAVLDEAGFIEDLEYVVKSVLMPQFLTTDGRMIFSSTSPRTPNHPFVKFVDEAIQAGAYIKKTIYDDSREEVQGRIEEWIKEAGGKGSTTWRREYECELIVDQESAILPEFTRSKEAEIVVPYERPPFAIHHVVIDLGLIDHTAVLFAYVDFQKAKIIVEDELTFERKDSQTIAEAIKKKLLELWPHKPKTMFWADGPALTVYDFVKLHGLETVTIPKDELDAMVNNLRLMVTQNRILINPRCQGLVAQMRHAVWDKAHKKFDRTEPKSFGHFDLVASLMYLARVANFQENPYPANYGMGFNYHIGQNPNRDQNLEAFANAILRRE